MSGATCPGQELEVGLANAHVHFFGISGAVACSHVLAFHPGSTVVHVVISAKYEICGGTDSVPCGANGEPGLPPGRYTTDVVVQGFPAGTKSPTPESVDVTSAAPRSPEATQPISASLRDLSLESFDFLTPATGLGVFTWESPSGRTCTDYVGRSTDGGEVFHSLAKAVEWNCEDDVFDSSLTTDGHGDVFLYGPQLYVSHDGARTWASSPQPGSVVDVDAVGRSVWLVESTCVHADVGGSSACPVRVLASSDGGRTWAAVPTSPKGWSNGLSNGAHGQSYLVRTSRSSAYLMLAPHTATGTNSSFAPLWFTSNGGRSWSNRQVPCHLGAWSSVLSVAPDGELMAVCSSQPGAGSQPKSVVESDNRGRSWTLKTTSNIDEGYLGSVDLLSDHTAFLVGERSSLLVTHDGGATWTPIQPFIGSTAGGTFQVTFFSSKSGLVLGNDDYDNERLTLWSTDDGGRRWTTVVPKIS